VKQEPATTLDLDDADPQRAVPTNSLPLSGLFAIDKPAGVVTMKLLNSINELLSTSDLFLPAGNNDSKNDRYNGKKRKRGPSRAGRVKLGQGGTLDPLASGVLG